MHQEGHGTDMGRVKHLATNNWAGKGMETGTCSQATSLEPGPPDVLSPAPTDPAICTIPLKDTVQNLTDS